MADQREAVEMAGQIVKLRNVRQHCGIDKIRITNPCDGLVEGELFYRPWISRDGERVAESATCFRTRDEAEAHAWGAAAVSVIVSWLLTMAEAAHVG